MRNPTDTFERRQRAILIDTVRNPAKAFLGGPDAQEAERVLRGKFAATDADIADISGETANRANAEELRKLAHTPNAHCTSCGTVGWQVNDCPACGGEMTEDDRATIRARYNENRSRS